MMIVIDLLHFAIQKSGWKPVWILLSKGQQSSYNTLSQVLPDNILFQIHFFLQNLETKKYTFKCGEKV